MERYKRVFTVKQFRKLVFDAVYALNDVKSANKNSWISKEMRNHINLAVTEVNGCRLCSYKHAKEALELGMSDDDLNMYLAGNIQTADKGEAVALMFAQHYAETMGEYSEDAWNQVIKTYGINAANGIMGNIKAIMCGNVHGIAVGALIDRVKGKAVEGSGLCNEIAIVFSILIFIPAGMISSIAMKTKIK